jgi:hypothetical protein
MNEYKKYKPFNVGLFTYLTRGISETDKPINESQSIEATEQGLTLLSRTSDPNHNKYKFNDCGCTQYIQPTHVRRGNTKCKTCFLRNLVDKVHNKGCAFVSKEDCGNGFLMIIKPCGCLSKTSYQSLDSSYSTCSLCFKEDIIRVASENGYVITKSLGGGKFEITIDSCQHSKVVHNQQIFRNNIVCRICNKPAKSETKVKSTDNYKLPCGHIRPVSENRIRHQRWVCDICENSHSLKPTIIYLIKIKTADFEWLKLGFAKNIKYRWQMYSIKNAEYETLRTIEFATTKDAARIERGLHSIFKHNALGKSLMRKYMANGVTECYPVELLPDLIKGLDNAVMIYNKENNEIK